MEQYFKAVAAVLLAIIMVIVLRNGSRGIGELLSLVVCGMVVLLSVQYLRPVVDFLKSVQNLEGLDSEMLKILLKAVGISLTAEIAELICEDAGSSAMGKALQILAAAILTCMTVPLLSKLLELVEGVLRGL